MTSLVLAFDAHCSTCSAVGAAVRETVGDRIEVLPIDHSSIAEYEPGRFGKPVTINRTSGSIYAGPGLAMRLVPAVGVWGALRLIRVLGELKADGGFDLERANSSSLTISRRTAIEIGLGFGVAAALTGMSRTPAQAALGGLGAQVESRVLPAAQVAASADDALAHPDLVNLLPSAISSQPVSSLAQVAADGAGVAFQATDGRRFEVMRSTNEFENVVQERTLVYDHSTSVAYLAYINSEAVQGEVSRADALKLSDDGAMLLALGTSINGALPVEPSDLANTSAADTASAAAVPLCGGCYLSGGHTRGYYSIKKCKVGFTLDCILYTVGCSACLGACSAGTFGVGCWGCLLSACLVATQSCCGDSGERFCVSCPDGE